MKQIFLLTILLMFIQSIIFTTPIVHASGDIRAPSRGLNDEKTKLTKDEIFSIIGNLKKYIQALNNKIRDLKNNLEGASSIKGMAKDEISLRENKILMLNRYVNDAQGTIAGLKEQLTTI